MPTNPRDAFRGQSRLPDIVPFHMLGILSSCAVVTFSLRQFLIFDFKKYRDLEIRVRGHLRSLKKKLLLQKRNIWNGTMFGDLDWPLNASRGFVSIS